MFEKILENLCRVGNDKVANYADGDYYASFYGDENLPTLHCGVCNTPKEFYPFMPKTQIIDINGIAPVEQRDYIFVDENGNPQKVPCLCKCRENSYKVESKRAELQKKIAENKLKCWGYMCNGAFIRNTEMEKVTFDRYEQNKFIDKAAGYYSSYADRVKEKKGLMFCGTAGAGKTVAAMCLANALLNRGVDVRFMQQFQITALSKIEDKREFEDLGSCKVLFIDDYNEEQLTDYGIAMLQDLYELRIKRGLLTCFTSNITKEALENPSAKYKLLDERITANCYVVHDKTHNYRLNPVQ